VFPRTSLSDALEERGHMDWEDRTSVLKALVLLYSLQTEQEKSNHNTVEDNDVGFNAIDAPFLTSVAEQMLVRKRGISSKQFTLVKTKLRKYQRQILSFGIRNVTLPETAVVYVSKDEREKYDGVISTDGAKLLFHPYIYPSKQVKSIGFTWGQDGNGCWEAPLSLSKYEQLLEVFDDYVIDETITKWIEELERPPELSELITDSKLLAFQREAVGFMIKEPQRGLLGLAPGLGKTPVSVLAMKELGGRTLVICPYSLLYNWKREIEMWADENAEIWHGWIGRNQANWVITNYETALNYMVSFDIKKYTKDGKQKVKRVNWRPNAQYNFDNLIVDESVLIKNRYAQRSRAVYTLANKLKQIKRVYLLSGSPTTKFLDDMWHQFHVLDPERFSSYWKFVEEYCVTEENYWGTAIVANQKDAPTRLKQQQRDIYFARTQDQVLDLPDWLFDTYEVPMDPKQAVLYKDMQDNFVARLPDGNTVVAPNILSQMTRLIQLASDPQLLGGPSISPKTATAIDLMEFEQFPVIFWTNFVSTAEHLHEMLTDRGLKSGLLIGKTKDTTRDMFVQKFQRNALDAIVAHPGVGKFGLTLTAARTAIYVERSYDGDNYYQSLHRVRRFGTTHSPHVIILLSNIVEQLKLHDEIEINEKPTIDHVIHKVLGFKRENSIQITTGLIRETLGV